MVIVREPCLEVAGIPTREARRHRYLAVRPSRDVILARKQECCFVGVGNPRVCFVVSLLPFHYLTQGGDLPPALGKAEQFFDKAVWLPSVLTSVLGECTLMG